MLDSSPTLCSGYTTCPSGDRTTEYAHMAAMHLVVVGSAICRTLARLIFVLVPFSTYLHHKLRLISLFHDEALASKCGVQHLPSRNCNCMKMSHACSFDGNPIAHVQINVTFSLGCQDKSLHVRIHMLFDFTQSSPAELKKFWNTRRDLCVRRNTG